jgi:hypothetical protein
MTPGPRIAILIGANQTRERMNVGGLYKNA